METVPASSTRTVPSRAVTAALVAGTIAWIGVVAIAVQLDDRSAASLGFDLELLLEAGRAVAAGRSPYAPELVAGGPPLATSLFYSYPPPVAQAISVFAAVPSRVMLVLWSLGAIIGFLAVMELLRRRLAPQRSSREVAFVAAACAPLTLPFAIALLFGNLDAWFPFLYGAMLLAAIAPGRASAVGAGLALVAAAAKLHPATMGLWFLTRALRQRAAGGPALAGLVVLMAIVVGALVVGASLALGGTALWSEYGAVVRSGAQAAIVDPRNAGIAAHVAGLIGGDDALARSLHVFVAVVAVLVTVWAAWRRPDPVESFAWATAASLATLPVTWYHYPSALLPVAAAALLRASGEHGRRVSLLVTAGAVVAAVALVWLPLLWVAVGLIVLAARLSGEQAGVIEGSRPEGRAPEGG